MENMFEMEKLKKMTSQEALQSKKASLLIVMLTLFLAFLPFVQAVSPFISSSVSGCQITPIIRESLKVSQDFDFNFHVFNVSNGVPLSDATLSCYFHFYNQTGDHVFSKMLANDPSSEHLVINEWAERMSGGNISTTGSYAYVMQCNSTTLGCVDKGYFIVTNSGYDATTGRATIDIGLLLILVIFLAGAVAIFMSSENLLAKVGMVGCGYLLLIAITFIAWQLAGDFLLSAPFLVSIFRIIFLALVIGLIPLVIGGFAWYFYMLFRIKEIQNLMDRGIGYEEAERRQGRKYR